MITALTVLLIITSLLMILLILLHKGRGGGLSDMFGGGGLSESRLAGSPQRGQSHDSGTVASIAKAISDWWLSEQK